MVLFNPMGRLFVRSLGLSFLCRRVVTDSFQEVGVMPVVHMMRNKRLSDILNEWGMMRMSSLGIPSGPAALLFFSLRKIESKVNWRKA
jgi:hypothetical protein